MLREFVDSDKMFENQSDSKASSNATSSTAPPPSITLRRVYVERRNDHSAYQQPANQPIAQLQSFVPQPQETRTCYKCGKQGHIGRYCNTPQHVQQSQYYGQTREFNNTPQTNVVRNNNNFPTNSYQNPRTNGYNPNAGYQSNVQFNQSLRNPEWRNSSGVGQNGNWRGNSDRPRFNGNWSNNGTNPQNDEGFRNPNVPNRQNQGNGRY